MVTRQVCISSASGFAPAEKCLVVQVIGQLLQARFDARAFWLTEKDLPL